MAVLNPIRLVLVNHAEAGGERVLSVPDFPPRREASPMHTVAFTPHIFIDAADFRFEVCADLALALARLDSG